MTTATVKVLDELIKAGPDGERWGYELMDSTGLASGSLYPILSRLERHHLIASRWGEPIEDAPGRPRRRYYRMTAQGALALHQAERVEFEAGAAAAWGFV
jgi:DNA-binding PadR family transcriptional regulator